MNNKLGFFIKAISVALISLNYNSGHADPHNVPLPLASPAIPNIFFLNDDSSTMESELLTNDLMNDSYLARTDSHTPALIHRIAPYYIEDTETSTVTRGTETCVFSDGVDVNTIDTDGSDTGYISILETKSQVGVIKATEPCDVVSEMEWRARLNHTNPLYFDPTEDYEPWPGKKANNSQRFPRITLNGSNQLIAPIDPTLPSSSDNEINLLEDSAELTYDSNGNKTRDLYDTTRWDNWCSDNGHSDSVCRGWRYYTWIDTDNDDIVDSTELTTHWLNQQTDEIKEKFANWFTYHRSRKFVARYALGEAIAEASRARTRFGYGGVNEINEIVKDNTTVGNAKIELIDNYSATHERNVLDKLYSDRTTTSSGTGLQYALDWAGEYFQDGGTGDNVTVTSPINNACQINNAVMLTDGFYTDDIVSTGSGFSVSDKIFAETDTTINNADSGAGSPYNNGESHSDTLADIAMHYWETDLSTSLDNVIIPTAKDTQIQQHLNTYTVAFGLKGNITESDVWSGNSFTWENPHADRRHGELQAHKITQAIAKARIDDLLHAAVNGRGQYLNASDPDTLIDALRGLVRNLIKGRQMGTNSVGTTSFFLNNSGKIFVTSFDPIKWTGELKAYSASTDASTINTSDWTTSPGLWRTNNTFTTGNGRKIFTYNADTGKGVSFEWASLSTSNQNLIRDEVNESDTDAQARLNYLRGESDSGFRARESLLGDIVGSSPKYVGPPPLVYHDSAPFGDSSNRFSTFWTTHNITTPRTPIVYIGANDGMLHGFNAATGAEMMAYTPHSVFSKLKNLAEDDYSGNNHEFFVDQTPTVADAFFAPKSQNGAATETWNTVLAGGLGAGGKGLYALNITDPTIFANVDTTTEAEKVVLWEFTNSDDSDFGYSMSKPVIALMETGRWAVITGNGPDSDDDNAALFIIYLDADPTPATVSGEDGWAKGENPSAGNGNTNKHTTADYVKIPVPGSNNGLFTPTAVDVDSDGKVDRVYAGDLEGNMWAFDLSDDNASNGLSWGIAYNDGSNDIPLFKTYATDADKGKFPITAKPTVARHPDKSTGTIATPNLMVYFGSGKYYEQGDHRSTGDTQSFYGILDEGSGNITESNLTGRTLHSGSFSHQASGNTETVTARITQLKDINSDTQIIDYTTDKGWYIELSTGERVFTEAIFFQDIIIFTTYIPEGTDDCTGGGTSWVMFLDAINGFNPKDPIVNVNDNPNIDGADKVDITSDNTNNATTISGISLGPNEGTLSNPIITNENIIVSGTSGNKAVKHNLGKGSILGKRISWKELRQ